MSDVTPCVYLLHFYERYPLGKRPQHYLGAAVDLERRLREHRSGSSKSRVTRAFHAKGIGFWVVRVWARLTNAEAFELEKTLKRRRDPRFYCPICDMEDRYGADRSVDQA